MAEASPGWFPAPSPGDIVWCRYPQGQLSGPGPKARPTLVLRVGENEGHPAAVVAYGTSRRVDTLHAGEFAITPADQAAYQAAGLSYATKFNLGETFELDFNDKWFAVPPGSPYGQTPQLGVLHPSLMRRAKAAFDAAARARRR
jgi:hypothetical protein